MQLTRDKVHEFTVHALKDKKSIGVNDIDDIERKISRAYHQAKYGAAMSPTSRRSNSGSVHHQRSTGRSPASQAELHKGSIVETLMNNNKVK